MPIEKLGLSGGTFRDLTPLAGLPLKEVHLHRCPGVADVAVLAQIPTLERITVPALARSIESLRALPRLQLLSFSLTTSFPWIPDTTTGDFWEEWPKLGWLHALHQSGFKPVDLARLPDHTWEVDLDNTAIRDLSILVGAPVSKLGLQGTRVTDLEPLRGMPLRQLRLHGAKIASLEPLRGMGLDELVISGTLVTDLSPLLGMPLAKLHLGGAPVADLSPLRGMPLAEVKMAWCSQITDLSPLSESLTLENLTLPPNARDIEFLRRITTIRHISFTEHSSTYLPDKTAGRFWREYEERHQFRALPGTADRRRKLADGTWELDLSDLDFSDLSLVAALPVSSLNLTRTKITSLDPLRGMKLNKLVLSETAIADLGPLADMPLTVLNLRGCARLRDLSPLQRCRSLKSLIVPLNAQNIELLRALHLVRIGYKDTPVKGGLHGLPAAEFWADLDANPWQTALRKAGILFRRLEKLADGTWDADFERTGIRGLKLLQGAPISMLRIGGTQVTDLSPLRDMSLTHLAIYNTQVADIGPLQGMPLVQLHASSTPVKDISVLRGMPLRQVRLHHCSHLTDVSPLAGCADLTDLTLPPNAANYEFLRDPARFPRLTHLSFEENPAQSGLRQPKHTVAEFWKSYDARKKP
jgi:Leucine-rich repeat (LRR) protein